MAILSRNGLTDGKFLVRNSIKCHGYYVLSVSVGGKAYHFQIKSRVRSDVDCSMHEIYLCIGREVFFY